jgi:hypothetical protein
MKLFTLIFSCIFLLSCDPKDLSKILDATSQVALTDADISNGLKEALNLGVNNSVSFLSAPDGYYKSIYKILLPAEAKKITDKLSGVPGFSDLENEAIKRINRAAEDASSKAGSIFLNAIKQMSFSDVTNILMGDKNAATQFLHRTTYNALYSEFKPVVINSLNTFGALDYWAKAVNTYNKIPFVDKVNPDLADHVTSKALEGLFSLIEKKELGIRQDISQRTSDLLKKVFAKQD